MSEYRAVILFFVIPALLIGAAVNGIPAAVHFVAVWPAGTPGEWGSLRDAGYGLQLWFGLVLLVYAAEVFLHPKEASDEPRR